MAKDTYNPLNSFKKSIRKVNVDDDKSNLNQESINDNSNNDDNHNDYNNCSNKSGYLFMKIDKRVMQSWSRKYFTISGELLYYRNRNIKV
ncbi:83_t:CDS:1 [Entrophospora sp. SA101]|nr:83_t:CDS:1 [Entrophospora sp. SA101]CAJ0849945.1 13131_t:CDS:1 [Entrophospora sp. SA101]